VAHIFLSPAGGSLVSSFLLCSKDISDKSGKAFQAAGKRAGNPDPSLCSGMFFAEYPVKGVSSWLGDE
jgi:hypothetical protein